MVLAVNSNISVGNHKDYEYLIEIEINVVLFSRKSQQTEDRLVVILVSLFSSFPADNGLHLAKYLKYNFKCRLFVDQGCRVFVHFSPC